MTFDLEKDLALALKNGGFVEATDPDLSKFKARAASCCSTTAGRIPACAPQNTIITTMR